MRFIAIPVAVLGLAAAPAFAATTKISVDSQSGKTEFVAVGKPAMLRIKGEAKGPHGEVVLEGDEVTGSLTLELDGLSTGISLRDEHMKVKYLETAKFPDARLRLTQTNVKGKEFKGELTLHGVTQPVSGTVAVEPTPVGFKVSSAFKISLSDFKIEIPSYAGIRVAENVDLQVRFEAMR